MKDHLKKKLKTKNLNKLCKITWKDAKSEMHTTLHEFLKEGFAMNESVGWLIHVDRERVVITFERSKNLSSKDLTMIPKGWITEIDFLE